MTKEEYIKELEDTIEEQKEYILKLEKTIKQLNKLIDYKNEFINSIVDNYL